MNQMNKRIKKIFHLFQDISQKLLLTHFEKVNHLLFTTVIGYFHRVKTNKVN